jgi:hypothetical protein
VKECPYCSRPLAGDICSAHGFVGPQKPTEAVFPFSGAVIEYTGAVTNIPAGWALCDGTNGTPDLRGLFIVGAGGTYAVGATGGSNAAHTHGVTVDSVSLSTGELAHSASSGALGWAEGSNVITDIGAHAAVDLTHGHTASSGSGSSMPAYYALARIMFL